MNYVCVIVARTTFNERGSANRRCCSVAYPTMRRNKRLARSITPVHHSIGNIGPISPKPDLSLNPIAILHSAMISRFFTLLPFLVAATAFADEGMWLFNNPPLKQLKEKYQFEPTPQWLEHLQKASVRFNSGGSGSFVSASGLCITNHHVGADALQKASTEQHNYLKDGFYAKTNADEIKCADLELNILMSIEDVTGQVNAAVKSGMSADAAG